MKIAFAGTPEFARVALQALHEAGHEPGLVLTQPDRPAGRGLRLQASAVKQWAQMHRIPVLQPRSLRLDGRYPDEALQARRALADSGAQVLVVAAYGLLLPQWVLDDLSAPQPDGRPRLGCLNIHASLLPRWRGAAPIHRAIEAGDDVTGITIMQMDIGLDTGDMLLSGSLPVRHRGPDADTTATLHDRLAALGGQLVVQALRLGLEGRLTGQPQPAEGVSYAAKIDKAEAALDWSWGAPALSRKVRALNPAPGAHTLWRGEPLKLWHAHAGEAGAAGDPRPGTVLAVSASGIQVATGEGVLVLTEVQSAGSRRLPMDEWLRGHPLRPGERLGAGAGDPA